MDADILIWFHSLAVPPWDAFFSAATHLGDMEVLVSLASIGGLTLWALGRRRDAVFLVSMAGLAWGLQAGLKPLLHRPRPDLFEGLHPSGWSMPSGHALGSACLFPLFAKLAARRGAAAARWLDGLAWTLIATIGVSRLVLGVHWPTDVLAGLLIGSGAGLAGLAIYQQEKDLERRGGVHRSGGTGQVGQVHPGGPPGEGPAAPGTHRRPHS